MNYMCIENSRIIVYNSQKLNKILEFQYQPFTIQEINNTSMKPPDVTFYALLGMKILEGIPFLIIALEAQSVCNIGASVVYEIKKIEWIPVAKKERIQAVFDKVDEIIKDLAKLFQDGKHYFSDLYKLHTTYYHNIVNHESAEQRKFYSQFIFNEGLMTIDQNNTITAWCKPIIQGYVQQFITTVIPFQKIGYTIISRRSYKKQGTRYFSRGIDDKGYVANFTETQQLICYGKFIISHLQIRGSVPAFFQQTGVVGLTGQLNICRNQALTQKAFRAHFAKLKPIYGRIFCINLLSIKKSQEQKLTVFYQKLINSFSPDYVKYQYFDFHEQCKNNQFQNTSILIDKIKQLINSFGATVFDTKLMKVITKQQGVFRINCLDCLDRTNYVQSRIALYQLEKVVINFSNPQVRKQIYLQELFLNKVQDSSLLLKNFNSAWADNGDSISIHYTGVGSTHTDITKTGERTFMGTINHKMRSAHRFFFQFNDLRKNQAIQTIHDNPLLKSKYSFQIKQKQQGQFINIVLMSFDLNQFIEYSAYIRQIENYVLLKKPAGIVLYGFFKQQKGILSWFKGKKQDISTLVKQKIETIKRLGYQVIKNIINNDSYMIIFGNQIPIKNITDLKFQNVYNKDNSMTICKFNIFQSSMVFAGVNCSTFQGFIQLIQKSHQQAFQFNKLGQARSSSIISHCYRTILGNTASSNIISKQQMQNKKIQADIMKKKQDGIGLGRLINYIFDGDQLANAFPKNIKYLKNYTQGPPSYLLEGNRIIFWNKQQLITRVLDYSRSTFSNCTYGYLSYQL